MNTTSKWLQTTWRDERKRKQKKEDGRWKKEKEKGRGRVKDDSDCYENKW